VTSESEYALFERFPELEKTIPTLGLGVYPSPVRPMPNVAKALGQGYTDKVWVKRDDLNNEDYGGNKVRKFELEYAPLKKRGYDTVATMGGIGTNQGVAAAIFCKQLGLECAVVLHPQPITEDVRNKLMLLHTTDSGVEAFKLAAEDGLELDLTYTGKTLAGMLDRLRKEPHSTALFWVTNHTGDLSPYWRDVDYRDLPKEFHPVYEGELEYSWSELLGRPW